MSLFESYDSERKAALNPEDVYDRVEGFPETVIVTFKKAIVDKPTLVIFTLVTILAYFTAINPIIFVVAAAIAGIIIQQLKGRESK